MLPRALSDFTREAQNPNADPRELSKIIETDSGLSSELLRHVNSCTVGVKSKVTSVQQAMAMFGIRSTQLYLSTSGIKHAMKSSKSKLINFQNFWNTNLERALLARETAKLLKTDVELAFTAAVLQDFLLPLITNELFDGYLEFTEHRDNFANLVSFERKKFGWEHAQAGGQVMHAWGLPDELVCCVLLHHRGIQLLAHEKLSKTAAAAVAISALLPDAIRQEADGIAQLIQLEESWAEFQLLPIAERVDEEFQALAPEAKNHFSFLRFCRKALERMAAEPQSA